MGNHSRWDALWRPIFGNIEEYDKKYCFNYKVDMDLHSIINGFSNETIRLISKLKEERPLDMSLDWMSLRNDWSRLHAHCAELKNVR